MKKYMEFLLDHLTDKSFEKNIIACINSWNERQRLFPGSNPKKLFQNRRNLTRTQLINIASNPVRMRREFMLEFLSCWSIPAQNFIHAHWPQLFVDDKFSRTLVHKFTAKDVQQIRIFFEKRLKSKGLKPNHADDSNLTSLLLPVAWTRALMAGIDEKTELDEMLAILRTDPSSNRFIERYFDAENQLNQACDEFQTMMEQCFSDIDDELANSSEEEEPSDPNDDMDDFPLERLESGLPDVSRNRDRYFGYVRRYASFYNFYVLAKWENGQFVKFDSHTVRDLFPNYGTINLYPNKRVKLTDGAFYVLDFNEHDLEVNVDTTTGFERSDIIKRIDLEKASREKRFFSVQDHMGYLVVDADFDNAKYTDNGVWCPITISKENQDIIGMEPSGNIQVVIRSEDFLFGPYSLSQNGAGDYTVVIGTSQGVSDALMYDPFKVQNYEMYCSAEKGTAYFAPVEIVFGHEHERRIVDIWPTSTVVEKIAQVLRIMPNPGMDVNEWMERAKEMTDAFTDDPRIRFSRLSRVAKILKHDQSNEFFTTIAASVLSQLLQTEKLSEAEYARIVDVMLDNPGARYKLEGVKKVEDHIRLTQEHLESLNKSVKEQTELSKEKTQEVEKLDRDITKRKAEIAKGFQKERDRLTKEIQALNAQNEALKAAGEDIEDHIQSSVKDAKKYAFDGLIASKMLDAASAWAQEGSARALKAEVEDLLRVPHLVNKGKPLADYLVRGVQRYRDYDRDTILNLFLTVNQNFLTVFSGAPGSGKTSICNIMANVLGLDAVQELGLEKDAQAANRYLPISVERGWTSKRDLVGYWNPLTKTFESLDARRYEAFKLLDAEKRAGVSRYPFLMLLDEANLSPMEYYWAEFMNICDARNDTSTISLGDKAHYYVPNTLRFVATINNDHTTERLSPRLIDRAAIVTLPEMDWSEWKPVSEMEKAKSVVNFNSMQALFDGTGELDKSSKAFLGNFYHIFADKLGLAVSARTHEAVQKHVVAGIRLFSGGNEKAMITAMDFAVSQKLLPMIAGSGVAYREALEHLLQEASRFNMKRTERLLKHMIEQGKQQMDFYRFF